MTVLTSNVSPESNTKIQPLHTHTSEDVFKPQSSEGVTSSASDRLNTSITPINTDTIPTHPSLYPQQSADDLFLRSKILPLPFYFQKKPVKTKNIQIEN